MTKEHFIELANYIKMYQRSVVEKPFTEQQISHLAAFCKSQNGNFDRERWLAYIAGECGPNGGKV